MFSLTLPAIIFTLLVLELVFRLAIPASDPPHAYYDPNDQILRFDVDGPQSGNHTVGKLAQVRGEWQINNFGWNSEIEYRQELTNRPRIAIIGDSFVAALHLDVEDSMPGQLRRQIGDEVDVYSFGTSGAPMSQYLQMSRYVNRNFNPDLLVFNVVDNDFDSSLCEVSRLLGMMCLENADGRVIESEIVPYTPSKIRRWARKSSLIRYVFLNLNLETRFRRTVPEPQTRIGAPVGSPPVPAGTGRVENAIDYILRTIAEENHGKTVIFIIDGPRRTLYDDESPAPDELTLWKHGLLRDVTSRYGFHFIDLTDSFRRKYKQDGERFNSEHDYHWNENGHFVAAEALLKTLKDIDVVAK